MISFKDFGWRLGNQMFQIANAESIAKDKNDEVFYPEWKYSNIFKRNITPKKVTQVNHIFKENGFHYQRIMYKSNMILDGYFQSEKYFKHNKDHILSIFEFNDDIQNKIKNRFIGVDFNNSTSIHVRRGDYIKYPNHHPMLTMEYYQKAMSTFNDTTFIVCSDDIEWCKNNFTTDLGKFIFIEGQEDYEDMYLMSICKNNIIANSSFSWWSAWLNKNDDKIVIAPKKWFGPAYSHFITTDLYCDSWVVI